MATINLAPMRFSRNVNGAAEETRRMTFVSGGVAVFGDLMTITDNVAAVCGADPAFIGLQAMSAYTEVVPGDPTATQIYRKVRPTDIWIGNIYHSTAALAVLADATVDEPLQYGVVKVGSNWHIDLEETSNKRVTIIKRLDTATDVYARCEFQFMAAYCTFT